MARILSVSYDNSLVRSREMLLEHEGYNVVSSVGFTASIAHCKEDGFDLFILGHSIPHSDRQQLIDTFRKHCPAPIIALRRNAGDEPVRGADYHIEPDPETLLGLVSDIIHGTSATRRAG